MGEGGSRSEGDKRWFRKRRKGEEVSLSHSTNLLNTLPVTGLETPLLALRCLLMREAGISASPVVSAGSGYRPVAQNHCVRRDSSAVKITLRNLWNCQLLSP